MKKWWIFIVLAVTIATFAFTSCSTGGGEYLIIAAVNTLTSLTSAAVTVHQNSSPVTTAMITINGDELVHLSAGLYMPESLVLSTTVNAGDTVNLSVQVGGSTFTATVTMPEKPSVIDPSPISQSSDTTIDWTIGEDPDQYYITVLSNYTVSGEDYTQLVSNGSLRSAVIPANTFDAGKDPATVQVGATNVKSIADAAGDSELQVINMGLQSNITVNP